jgi:hypothetical protein
MINFMYTKYILVFLFCLLWNQLSIAGEKFRFAVPSFRNSTGKTLRTSGSEMAKWMSKELQKNKKFELIDSERVGKITANAKWNETRYVPEIEERFRKLPADFLLYGRIEKYLVQNYILPFPRGDEPQVPEVIVEFSIRAIDLSGRRRDQEFTTNGDWLGDASVGFGSPPYNEEDSSLDVVFLRASRKAMHKAVSIMATHLPEQ